MNRASQQIFTLTLVAERGGDAIRGLRWLLKRALRAYGLRCIDARQVNDIDARQVNEIAGPSRPALIMHGEKEERLTWEK